MTTPSPLFFLTSFLTSSFLLPLSTEAQRVLTFYSIPRLLAIDSYHCRPPLPPPLSSKLSVLALWHQSFLSSSPLQSEDTSGISSYSKKIPLELTPIFLPLHPPPCSFFWLGNPHCFFWKHTLPFLVHIVELINMMSLSNSCSIGQFEPIKTPHLPSHSK